MLKISILLTLCTKPQGINFWKQFASILFSFSVLAFFVTPPALKCTKWGWGGRWETDKKFPETKIYALSWYMYVESFKFLSSIMKDFFSGKVLLSYPGAWHCSIYILRGICVYVYDIVFYSYFINKLYFYYYYVWLSFILVKKITVSHKCIVLGTIQLVN